MNSMKKYSGDDIRKLNMTGRSSYYLVLPKEMVKKLKWKKKQKLQVKLRGGKITISDAK